MGDLPINFAPDEKIEDLQCDGLQLIVRRGGFHYGTDSILLANYVKAGSRDNVIELCSGTGVVSILLSAKTRASNIVGVDIDATMVMLANRSAAINGIGDRVQFIWGDIRSIRNIRSIRSMFSAGSADVVVANPPYFKRGSGVGSSDADDEIARHEINCELKDVTDAAGWLLNNGGQFYIVYRPDRLVDLLCAMRNSGIEPKEIQTVCASVDKPPMIILVQGKKGASPGIRFLKQATLTNPQ